MSNMYTGLILMQKKKKNNYYIRQRYYYTYVYAFVNVNNFLKLKNN